MSELYASASEFKLELWPAGSDPDDLDDSTINDILDAVSRWIDSYTGTRFYSTSEDEVRYLTASDERKLFTPDILTVTTLQTDDGTRTYPYTWAATDYDLLPANAQAYNAPYRWIETTPFGSYSFPYYRNAVKITGTFGYCTISNLPAPIKRATLLQSARLYKRKDAPFGVVANPLGGEMRLVSEIDVDVERLLRPFRRLL